MHKQLLGAHISIAGGLDLAVAKATDIGCTSMQIFTKSNRSWFDKPLTPEEISSFKKAINSSPLSLCMVHASYLINIGSKEPATEKNSVKSLSLELQRAEQLEIPYLVLHPGSHVGAGTDTCIKKIANNLNFVLNQATGATKILIETMAGQGTNVGSTFEEIQKILELTTPKNLLGVCFDTCHVFSAGYGLETTDAYEKTFTDFDNIIGLDRLYAFHLNDSKTPKNSHKDRHEELGRGSIPLSFFKQLLNDNRFSNIPKILETPTDPAMDLYRRELQLLRSML